MNTSRLSLLMFAPLNGVQIDAFFVHFPNWAQVAHVVYPFAHFFTHLVEVFLRSETAQTETQ